LRRAGPASDRYVLLLFIAGATTRSHQAVMRVRELCAGPIKGRVKLKVIDLYQQPALARVHQIVATPTLVLVSPPPMRRFIGSLTNIADLFVELDVGARGRMYP
jgi:circadian clock protein KaiB